MYKIHEIAALIEKLAPLELAGDYDNVGLIVGRGTADVTRVLLALDATSPVINEAVTLGAQLIIVHHPPIWTAIKRINDATPQGCKLLTLAERSIAVYAAHTNLDACEGGINDILFDILKLKNKELFHQDKPNVFFGRAGTLSVPMALSKFARFVQDKLNLDAAVFCGDPDAIVRKVGIIGGSGARDAEFADALAIGCDTYITGDIKHDAALSAQDLGLNLIDATHYGSEIVFAAPLKKYLEENFPNLEIIISKAEKPPFLTFVV